MEGIGGHRQAAQERSGMNCKHLIQEWNKGLMRCVCLWGGWTDGCVHLMFDSHNSALRMVRTEVTPALDLEPSPTPDRHMGI